MELTAEILKVFGSEMAKIFSETIKEEEFTATAEKAFKTITEHKTGYPACNEPSVLEKAVANIVLERVIEHVNLILATDEGKAVVEKLAEHILAEAEEKAREILVDKIANNMAAVCFPNSGLQAASNQIAAAISGIRGR